MNDENIITTAKQGKNKFLFQTEKKEEKKKKTKISFADAGGDIGAPIKKDSYNGCEGW